MVAEATVRQPAPPQPELISQSSAGIAYTPTTWSTKWPSTRCACRSTFSSWKPQAGEDGSTALVVKTGWDLDPVQPPNSKCMVSERAEGPGDNATALRGLSGSIADARRPALQVDSVKAPGASWKEIRIDPLRHGPEPAECRLCDSRAQRGGRHKAVVPPQRVPRLFAPDTNDALSGKDTRSRPQRPAHRPSFPAPAASQRSPW
jgi:hypothetical protein